MLKSFGDNSQAHKEDILKCINGRIESSSYADGRYTYWVALLEGKPYSLIMTIKEYEGEERPQIKAEICRSVYILPATKIRYS